MLCTDYRHLTTNTKYVNGEISLNIRSTRPSNHNVHKEKVLLLFVIRYSVSQTSQINKQTILKQTNIQRKTCCRERDIDDREIVKESNS